MEKKIVCYVKDDEDIKRGFDELELLANNAINQVEFFKKKIDQTFKEVQKNKDSCWERIQESLKSKGLLENFNKEKHKLEYDPTFKAVLIVDKPTDDLSSLLRSIL